MATVKPIRTETDYDAALARIDELMGAAPGTPESDELDVLADLVEIYEARNEPMGYPTPIAAIEFRMEQAGLSPRDLVPFIGTRAKVSEVLSGKRKLTMPMARALHEHLGIPAEVLLQDGSSTFEPSLVGIEWERFPVRAMAKCGWIPKARNLGARAEECVRDLIRRAGGLEVAEAALYRKNDHARANAKTDPYALKAWCWQVLATANESKPATQYKPGTVTLEFLRELARLSWSDEGPRLAREFLAKQGISLVVVPHLPKTYLDGAALMLGDGTPVVGLTLRYDRLDNFWFCLLHEVAHIGRHIDRGEGESFIDDLTLRDVGRGREDSRELEADEWAEEALVPNDAWEAAAARENPTPSAVLSLAKTLNVAPAVIAGKIRHERKNYRMLSHFVGSGEVRRLLAPARKKGRAGAPGPA
jgi:HTH-type transcriptional regulator/antitoxin HigA